ncbi:MAG: CBS domain-containing protein [Candidatus Omnitrophica bacterium]|nr:CBS domain-containing protein [Candidatus Omnitrophota bacterium]
MSLENYDIRHLLKNVKIQDVMSSPCEMINMEEPMSAVEELFVSRRIRHLPIIDSAGKLVGLITKRDLFRTVAPRKAIDGNVGYTKDKILEKDGMYYFKDTLDSYVLSKVMIKDVKTLKADHVIADAIDLMVQDKVGCVPIVDNERKVVGIITRYDILKMADQIVKHDSI